MTESRTHSLVSLIVLALWPRLALIAVTMLCFPFPWERWIAMRDGARYIDYARYLGAGELAAIRELGLTFPGYPLAILLIGKLLGNGLAGVALNVGGALLAVLLFQRFAGKRHLSCALAVLPPAWVLYSSMVMTEGLFLAMVMLGILLFTRERNGPAFLVFSGALLIKLQAVFPLGACLLVLVQRRRFRLAAWACVLAALLPAGWAAWCQLVLGDALINLRLYPSMWDGAIFAWPGESLIRCSLDASIPLWKKLYVWPHVVVTLLACVLMIRRWRRDPRAEHQLLLTAWLVGNTACLLCLGFIWGFHEFHRYLLPALPPLLIAYERYLPQPAWVYHALGLVAVAMSVFALAG
jgi:hypothetical protein